MLIIVKNYKRENFKEIGAISYVLYLVKNIVSHYLKLIPSIYISADIAKITNKELDYIESKGLDNAYYKSLAQPLGSKLMIL